MWYSSKLLRASLGLAIAVLALSVAGGCMSDRLGETDMPWSAPAAWEGTTPMPSGFADRYQ